MSSIADRPGGKEKQFDFTSYYDCSDHSFDMFDYVLLQIFESLLSHVPQQNIQPENAQAMKPRIRIHYFSIAPSVRRFVANDSKGCDVLRTLASKCSYFPRYELRSIREFGIANFTIHY